MSVKISCPKCQQRYQLPESALGKAVKCKSCGVTFRTKAPGKPTASPSKGTKPAASAGRSRKKNQPTREELAEFGIGGPIAKRQADVFEGATVDPRSVPRLGNYAAEDPAFAETKSPKSKSSKSTGADNPHAASADDGLAAVLANPALSRSDAKAIKKRNNSRSSSSNEYALPRTGFRIFSFCLMLGMAVLGLITVLAIIESVAPDWRASLGESVVYYLGIAIVVLFASFGISLLMAVVAQIFCLFSPKDDEKFFAGLTVGTQVAAIVLPLLASLTIYLCEDGSDGIKLFAVVIMLGCMLGAFASALSTTFFFITYFNKIGRNIKSRELVDAAATVKTTWIFVFVISVVAMIALSVCRFVLGGNQEDQESLDKWIGFIGFLISAGCSFSLMFTMWTMTTIAIQKTARLR